ncbi:MAG TPA: ATPase domain-containing protein [Polyangia bacterium]|jgi:circadian clock protein KaiC
MPSQEARTGIAGLDDILRGGFPRGRIYLVEGDPGVGKTTLALRFLMEGRREGERVIYITLSETKEELSAVAASHGWTLDGIDVHELAAPAAFSGDDENTLFHPSEVELAETTKSVVDLCTRIRPQRVVFDSLSEIRLLAQSPLRYRREVLALKQYFAGRGCTVLLLDDRTSSTGDCHLQSIAHGVVSLEQLAPLYGAQRRRLRIVKLRGVPFRGGYHDFVIEHGGLRVFPRLVASEHVRPFERGAASSGIPSLDLMLGGGLDRGTSTLFLGPAGAGKSTLSTQWMAAAAARGERSALYAFDESTQTFISRSRSVGIDVEPVIQSGRVAVRHIDPAEIPPGQFVDDVRRSVDEEGIRLVVIDSINGYMNAMPDESFLLLQMHELLTFLGQRGVVTILVMAQHGLIGDAIISPTDVSYLADTVLLLRHFETNGGLRKAISVLKKRTGQHERTIRELKLSTAGITTGEPLTRLRGILTGVPLFQTEAAFPNGVDPGE